MEIVDLKQMPCFGVAGNFTGHLEQAGEASDFANVKTAETNAPKAIFPTYMPNGKNSVPQFLTLYPFDSEKIIYPSNEKKLQIEPECAIVCNVKWNGSKIESLEPICFGASNDCSIRKEGAKKISQKKNWGKCSKGLSDNLIPIDDFSENGIMQGYSISSFLVRDGNVYDYGENSPVGGYSYIYRKLVDWMIEKFNFQADEGPAENINSYLIDSGRPEKMMVSIGATRYTDFGEHNFLTTGDASVVVLYPHGRYSIDEIRSFVSKKDFSASDISFLYQQVEA
ncbi:MAG: hypothetical protein II716_02645 [Treponema sp.]|nr:hypothetical protein [Treponema sp.]